MRKIPIEEIYEELKKGDIVFSSGDRITEEEMMIIEGRKFQNQGNRYLIIPSYWRYIPNSVFEKSLYYEIQIPEGITSIGNHAFSESIYLESITIPASVKSIGHSAFYECKTLKKVIFSPRRKDQILSIDGIAFGETSIEEINIPDPCYEIGIYGFANCSKLKRIHLPVNLNKLNKDILIGCKNIQYIEIPKRFERPQRDLIWDLGLGIYLDFKEKNLINIQYY